MLSRICSSVDLVHRRGEFRASLVLQQRLLNNPKIRVRYHSVVSEFVGKTETVDGEEWEFLTHAILNRTDDPAGGQERLEVDGAFVAIGHDPNTGLLQGQVDMDANRYVVVDPHSTRTSTPGIFAAGDVADHVYRQAITSAGSGAMAALDAERYLSENPIEEDTCVRQEDFSSWTVRELRDQVRLLGLKCSGCMEKGDFVASLRATY